LTKILNLQFALESFEARINSREGNSIYCIPAQRGIYTKYVHIKSTAVYAPRRNGDSPQPPTPWLVCPLPPVSGGRGTLAGEKGVGRVPIPTRGIHCGTLYMYVLCVVQYSAFSVFFICYSFSLEITGIIIFPQHTFIIYRDKIN
jgi:hypothetical protein